MYITWLSNTNFIAYYIYIYIYIYIYKGKVKWSCYRPGVAQRVGRGIALLFYDRGTRRGLVVSSTARPHFTPGKEPVPTVQEAVWAPRPGGKSCPHQDSIRILQPVVSRNTDWATRPIYIYIHTHIYMGRVYIYICIYIYIDIYLYPLPEN